MTEKTFYEEYDEAQKKDSSDYKSGKIGLGSALLQSSGNVAKLGFDYLGYPIEAGAKGLFGMLPDDTQKGVEKGFTALVQKAAGSETGRDVLEWVRENPEAAGNVGALWNLLDVLPAFGIPKRALNSILGNTKTLVSGGAAGKKLAKITGQENIGNFYNHGPLGKGLSLIGQSGDALKHSLTEGFVPSAAAKRNTLGLNAGRVDEIFNETYNGKPSNALGSIATGRAIHSQSYKGEAPGAKGVLGDQWLDNGQLDWKQDSDKIQEIMFNKKIDGTEDVPESVQKWHLNDITKSQTDFHRQRLVNPSESLGKLLDPGVYGASFKNPNVSKLGREILGFATTAPVVNRMFAGNSKTMKRMHDLNVQYFGESSPTDPKLLMEVAQVGRSIDKMWANKASIDYLKSMGKWRDIPQNLKAQLMKGNFKGLGKTLREDFGYNADQAKESALGAAEVVLKARMKIRAGKKLGSHEKFIHDKWVSERGVGRLEDSNGNVISNDDWSKLKVPEDGAVHWPSNHLSASKEIGGVRTSQSMVFGEGKDPQLFVTLSDGHDMFGVNPIGGKGMLSLTPTMNMNIKTQTWDNLPISRGVSKGVKDKVTKLTPKEATLVNNIEQLTGIKKRRKESVGMHHARALKRFKAKATPKAWFDVMRNVGGLGVLSTQLGGSQDE